MHKKVCHRIGLASQWVAAIYPTDHIAEGGRYISIRQWWVVKDFGRQCAYSPFVRSFENSTVFIFLKLLLPDRKPHKNWDHRDLDANRKLVGLHFSYVFQRLTSHRGIWLTLQRRAPTQAAPPTAFICPLTGGLMNFPDQRCASLQPYIFCGIRYLNKTIQ